jgi:tripartite-type tricarboxylate transporter receptor subunit TctC
MIRIVFACALAALISAAAAGPIVAEDYPSRPVRVLVGFAAGSGPDIQARTVSQALGRAFGQSFVVENRTGANGTVAARAVATADGDGYTLLFSSASIASTPFLYRRLGYDVLRDLTPIATVGLLDGLFVLVKAASPIRSVADLIAQAKKSRVLYGSPGVGNGLHLATELFAQRAGITLQHIPYKGTSEVITALLSDSVDVMFVTTPAVIGLIKQGTLRPIAFTGEKPFPEFPDVPLMQQTLPGYPADLSWGMFLAPGKVPTALVEKLNAAIHAAILEADVAKVMQRDGYFPDSRNAAETGAFFRREVERTGEMVKAAKVEPN